jgi:hypothetical protein
MDTAERLREWVEATEACKSLAAKYFTGTFIPSDDPDRAPEKAVSPAALQELERLKRVADEKWERFCESV